MVNPMDGAASERASDLRRAVVPLAEYMALEKQLKQLQDQLQLLEQAKKATDEDGDADLSEQGGAGSDAMTAEQAMESLKADPVGFIRQVVDAAAEQHLTTLRDEAELQGVIRMMRMKHPEFLQFQPFILQETAELIKNDKDGVIDPWPVLLEKGMAAFREKFLAMAREYPERFLMGDETDMAALRGTEGAANRERTPEPPKFNREQIQRMSLEEFMANEAAINEALRQNRIR
jgi:hypothetical protein